MLQVQNNINEISCRLLLQQVYTIVVRLIDLKYKEVKRLRVAIDYICPLHYAKVKRKRKKMGHSCEYDLKFWFIL